MTDVTEHAERCHDAFSASIWGLRCGVEGAFSKHFVDVLDCIQRWLQETDTVGADYVVTRLHELQQCQATHDYIRLADILEYELYPALFAEVQ